MCCMLREEKIRGICSLLKEYDEDILEIVRFGSSVYAPELARDVDLLVITRKKKEYGGYLECLEKVGVDVDVVVKGASDKLNERFACNILGAFELLYGDGSYFMEMVKFDPSYDEAKAMLIESREDLKSALQRENEERKRIKIRTAFNGLFHAARIAAMTFLAIENSKWGHIRKELPHPYKEEFEAFIRTLHIEYFYNGNYPKNYEEEFEKWYKKVEKFISRLEKERKKEKREN